ncbi:MAG: subclass B1 metallo-beta-lactamase [Bacteroidetes bacterium]|nr:subclass B1 metallo-beta-lactamase [Bacteroidota bacterium]MBL7105283.1 subclass B1 metallo-beta-lactamase [Bacteroidales bacterium]
MIKINKIIIVLQLLILQSLISNGQIINISDKLTVTKLSENVYIHTCDKSNGIIYSDKGEAIIVSTPPSDEVTEELINWTTKQLNAKIIGYVIDRWHPDAMEGLDVVRKQGIKSYSYELTRTIAKEKGLPVPDIGFDPKLELKVGDKKIICHYFGPAHTSDGIVVWIPDEKVLFGGNEVRNYNGWVGNIADADIEKWPETIEKVKQEYGSAEIVIPGHGIHGGSELLDYTINLYKPNKWKEVLQNHSIKRLPVFNDFGDIFEIAEQDSINGNSRFLKEAIVFVDNDNRYIKVESPLIEHNVEGKSIKSEFGRLQIFEKSKGINNPTTDVYYKRLIINLRDDEVGIVIIMKEIL